MFTDHDQTRSLNRSDYDNNRFHLTEPFDYKTQAYTTTILNNHRTYFCHER